MHGRYMFCSGVLLTHHKSYSPRQNGSHFIDTDYFRGSIHIFTALEHKASTISKMLIAAYDQHRMTVNVGQKMKNPEIITTSKYSQKP